MRRPILLTLVAAALVGPAVFLAAPHASAQDATPTADCIATTAAENRDIVTRYLEAVSAHDGEAAAALSAEQVTFHSRSRGERPANGEELFQGQRSSFPDAEMTIDLLVAEGETVAAYVTWSGTLGGGTVRVSGQDVSVPGDQRDAEWVGSVFFTLECGKITDVWPLVDRLGHLMDLGVITEEDVHGAGAVATPQP